MSPGPCWEEVVSMSDIPSRGQAAYLQINIPCHFCRFPDVIRGWFLEIRDFNRVHAPFKTDNGGFLWGSSGCEIVFEERGVKSCGRNNQSKRGSFTTNPVKCGQPN